MSSIGQNYSTKTYKTMIQSLRDTRSKAHHFTNEYKDTIKESAESQSFLNDFFNIFGIHRRRVATFERPVRTDSRGVKSIDLLWEGVLLIEMKSLGQSLDKAIDKLYQKEGFKTPLERVKHLFELYKKLQ